MSNTRLVPYKPPEFKHQELNHNKSEIRLCKFRWNFFTSDGVSCVLRHFDLDSPDLPNYRALSYEWGPATPQRTILVNGHMFQIRENLFNYLDQVECLKYGNSWIWIDQIAINQFDTLERNHQVQMMKNIYSRAEQVIAWLGKETYASEYKVLQTLMEQNGIADYRGDSQLESAVHQIRLPTDSESLRIDSLFQKSYFERLWVVQEILLAQRVTVCYGQSLRVSWYALRLLARRVDAFTYDFDVDFTQQGPARKRDGGHVLAQFSHKGGNYDLKDVLKFAHNSCEDIRDKVYGLQGLVKLEQQIVIDYNKTCTEILVDVAVMLCHCGARSSLAPSLVDLARSMELTAGLQLRGFLLYLDESKVPMASGSPESRDAITKTLVGLWNGDIVKHASGIISSISHPYECELCNVRFRSEVVQKSHLEVLHPPSTPQTVDEVPADAKGLQKRPSRLSQVTELWLAGSDVKLKRLRRHYSAAGRSAQSRKA